MKDFLEFMKESFIVIWPFYLIFCGSIVFSGFVILFRSENYIPFTWILNGFCFIILGFVRIYHKEYRRVVLKYYGNLKDLNGGHVFIVMGICYIVLGIFIFTHS